MNDGRPDAGEYEGRAQREAVPSYCSALEDAHFNNGDAMRSLVFLIAALALSAAAQAAGLPFAVDSFQKARSLAKQDGGKHVLVFYTSEN